MKIDKDMPITLKLGVAITVGAAIFAVGQWSEGKLRDLSGLQEEVRSLSVKVDKLRQEFAAFNDDYTRREKTNNAAARLGLVVPQPRPPNQRLEMQARGSGQTMSGLGAQ